MRLRDLYGGSKETIYTPESKDSSISEKYTLQGKDAFLVLPEKILLDVGVAGLNLLYLIASFLLILSVPRAIIIFCEVF